MLGLAPPQGRSGWLPLRWLRLPRIIACPRDECPRPKVGAGRYTLPDRSRPSCHAIRGSSMPARLVAVAVLLLACVPACAQQRKNLRDYGVAVGVLQPGKWNAITDVPGVQVGQKTLVEGDDIRTGVTAILPYRGNIFQDKVPAAVYVGNGFGKLTGTTQIAELGNIETPIVLTNTLSVPTAADALIDYTFSFPANADVMSVNPVVGETNDGWLNDIRGRHVAKQDVLDAIRSAKSGPVAQGDVGAGTGTVAFGFKGGIGTSSRKLPPSLGGYTVGVLVQTNFGGVLGLGKTGGIESNGSGDYAIAFSTDQALRVPYESKSPLQPMTVVRNDDMSPLFMAAIEATEEAILNSLFHAETTTGRLAVGAGAEVGFERA